MNISVKQILWLNQQGERTIFDVFVENGEMGVYKWTPFGSHRFFDTLPRDERLVLIKMRKQRNNSYVSYMCGYSVKWI